MMLHANYGVEIIFPLSLYVSYLFRTAMVSLVVSLNTETIHMCNCTSQILLIIGSEAHQQKKQTLINKLLENKTMKLCM